MSPLKLDYKLPEEDLGNYLDEHVFDEKTGGRPAITFGLEGMHSHLRRYLQEVKERDDVLGKKRVRYKIPTIFFFPQSNRLVDCCFFF